MASLHRHSEKPDMGNIIVEQIVSADGYAAEEDGGIGFFHPGNDFSGTEAEQMRMHHSELRLLRRHTQDHASLDRQSSGTRCAQLSHRHARRFFPNDEGATLKHDCGSAGR